MTDTFGAETGKKLRSHGVGSPVEDVVIGSHGWRKKLWSKRINLQAMGLPCCLRCS
jgi:hypothetical protein